jgi:hypothetical protein
MRDTTPGDATGDARVDALLREIVAGFESTFPGRVRCFYVIGSFGDSSRVSASDLAPTLAPDSASVTAPLTVLPQTPSPGTTETPRETPGGGGGGGKPTKTPTPTDTATPIPPTPTITPIQPTPTATISSGGG